MKLVKRLALAVLAVAAVGALGCGGTAPLDVAACAEAPEAAGEGQSSFLECKEGTGLESVRLKFALGKGTRAVFATEIGSISCRKAMGEAVLEQRGAVLEGKVTELRLERCRERISFCSALNELVIGVPIEPVEVNYLGEREPQARLVLRRPGTFVSLECAFVGEVACTYGKGDSLAGTISNPPAQELRFDAPLKLWRGSESCPQTAAVRMTTDIEAENLVLDDGTRLGKGRVWVAREK